MENEELLKYTKIFFVKACTSMNLSTELEDKKYYEGRRNAYEDIIGLLENDVETVEHVKNFYNIFKDL